MVTESESEEGEIEDQGESDFERENPEKSKKNGYNPIMTNSEDELNLHSDGEIQTGENKIKKTTNRKYIH